MGKGEYCVCNHRWDYHRGGSDSNHNYTLFECEECDCKKFEGDMEFE